MTQADIPQDITLDAALTLLADVTPPQSAFETASLADAQNRVLAEDVTATINVPQQDTAAVDGYAFYHDDLGASPLPIIGAIKAGHPLQEDAQRGNAYRIFTGAPMPAGPDTVAMQEDCSLDAKGNITLPATLRRGANFRPAGENVAEGEVILTKGTILGPAEIGLAAAIGRGELLVARRLTIAIISMGDEVVDAGSPEGFKSGMIHDSNRPMLQHLMEAEGHHVLDFGIISDDLASLTAAYNRAAEEADVILSSGGSSEGDEDHARASILANNGVIDFWRLALKPGRPMAAGRIGSTYIYCVPGNPVAAFVCTRLLVNPMLNRLLGAETPSPLRLQLPAGFTHKHRKGRTEYLRAKIVDDQIILNGRPGAGVLSSLTGADGLVEIPADHDDITSGDILPFLVFQERGL